MTTEYVQLGLPLMPLGVPPAPKTKKPFPAKVCPGCGGKVPRKTTPGDLCPDCRGPRRPPLLSVLICGGLGGHHANAHCCAIGQCKAIPF